MKKMGKRFISILFVLILLLTSVMTTNVVRAEEEGDDDFLTWEVVENDLERAGSKLEKAKAKTEPKETLKGDVRVSIVLDGKATIDAGFGRKSLSTSAALSYRNSLRRTQSDVASKISTKVLGGKKLDVVWNLTLAANIISAVVPAEKIDEIKDLKGVKDVVVEQRYEPEEDAAADEPEMSVASAMTGAQFAWAVGLTGAGSKVAIVDTGLDLDHQSFDADAFDYAIEELEEFTGNEYDLLTAEEVAEVWDELNASQYSVSGADAYKNSKVPYGYNYVDANFNVTHLNDTQGEHGSHVAGIAAANRYVKNSELKFVNAIDEVRMQGNAPDAQLLVMKVFGRGGGAYDSDYFAAIEDAIVLGADTVNLSLGSANAGFTFSPTYQEIIDGLTEADLIWTNSAGNNGTWADQTYFGYLYDDGANLASGGSPGTFANTMSVASVENDGMTGTYLSFDTGYFGDINIYYNESSGYGNEPMTTIAGEHEFIYINSPGVVSDDDGNILDDDFAELGEELIKGRIAICNRGASSFFEKANAAVENGAVATIIANNQATMIGMNLTGYKHTEPVVMISQLDGLYLRYFAPVQDSTPDTIALTEDMAALTVSVDEDGNYTFVNDGKYLTSGATGNALTFEETHGEDTSDYSKWTLEQQDDGTWFIANVNAKFKEKAQYLEYYFKDEKHTFSTYSINNSNIDAYKFDLYVENEEGTLVMLDDAPEQDDVIYVYCPSKGVMMTNIATANSTLEAEEAEIKEGFDYFIGTLDVGEAVGTEYYESDYYTMSDFSSFGVPGDLSLKPEITTPGGNIYSVAGTNVTRTGDIAGGTDQYELMSGTSMAAPQLAGIGAIMAQYVREAGLDEKAEELGITRRALIQSLLMSTATPLHDGYGDYYPVLNQGSGLANVLNALASNTLVLMNSTKVDGEEMIDISSYARDGKVKAELGDDPDRSGKYTVEFTLNNLTGAELSYDLDGEFFTQDVDDIYADHGFDEEFLGTWTVGLNPTIKWYVNGTLYEGVTDYDFDGNPEVFDDRDALAILDAVVDGDVSELPADADLNNDGEITTYDAYLALKLANKGMADVPANGSTVVRAEIEFDADELEDYDRNGTYIEGYLYAGEKEAEDGGYGVVHSIPVLGYYGSWIEPSMVDVGSYIEYAYGFEDRIPYMYATYEDFDDFAENYVDQGFLYHNNELEADLYLGGNLLDPYLSSVLEDYEPEYRAERNAINADNTILGTQYTLIRNAAGKKIDMTDAEGNVIDGSVAEYGMEYAAFYYANQGAWYNTSSSAGYGLKPEFAEGTEFTLRFFAAPEYYMNDSYSVVWDEVPPTWKLPLTVDNTAPVIDSIEGEVHEEEIVKTYLAKKSEAPAERDIVYICYPTTDAMKVMSGTVASKKINPVDGEVEEGKIVLAEGMQPLNVYVTDEGYSFTNAEGQYLTSGATGSSLTYTDEANDYSYWELEDQGDGVFYIKNKNALYNNSKPQYLEFYNNKFTTYSMSTSDAPYRFEFYEAEDPTTVVKKSVDLDINAHDNGYIAGLFIYDEDDNLIEAIAPRKDEKTEDDDVLALELEYDYALPNHLYVEVYDYALNMTTVKINLNKEELLEPVAIDIEEESIFGVVNSSTKLHATVTPWGIEDQGIIWTSSDESVAVVNEKGVVTGVGAGTAVITATASADDTKSDTCDVEYVKIEKELNGFIWDENGEVWPSQFNTADLPNYTKLTDESLKQRLVSSAYGTDGILYAASYDSSDDTSVLYTVDESTYEITEVCDIAYPVWDLASAPSIGDTYLYAANDTWILFLDTTNGYNGTGYNMADYIKGNYVIGVTLYGTVYHPTYGVTLDVVLFIDDLGYVYDVAFIVPYDDGTVYWFGEPEIDAQLGDGVDTPYFQSLFFDGEDLIWSRFSNNENDVDIIYVGGFGTEDSLLCNLGSFAKGVWPVGGLYVSENNEAEPTSRISNKYANAVIDDSVTMTKDVVLDPLNLEAVGKTDSIGEETLTDRLVNRNDIKVAEDPTNEDPEVFTIELKSDGTVENDYGMFVTHNGLVELTWNTDVLELQGVDSRVRYYAAKAEEGKLTFGFIDLAGVEADDIIAKVQFKRLADEDTVIVVDEKQKDSGAGEGVKEFEVAPSAYYDWGDILPEDRPNSVEEIPDGLWISRLETLVYDGTAQKQSFRVYNYKTMLKEGTDYTVKYANNKNAADADAKKAPTVTVTGKGNYKDKIVKTFTILPAQLNDDTAKVILSKNVFAYNKKVQKPTVTVEFNGKKLKAKTDYTFTYQNASSTEPGLYRVTVEGKGNFVGKITSFYQISENIIPMSTVKVTNPAAQTYTGDELKPAVKVTKGKDVLVEGVDYTLKYENNVNVGKAYLTVSGKGAYAGSVVKSFQIKAAKLTAKNTEVYGLPTTVEYCGVFEPATALVYGDWVLEEGRDYTVTFKNNNKVGTATVTFKGIGNYTGSFSKSVKITAIPLETLSIGELGEVPYQKGGSTPDVTIFDANNGVQLVKGKDYTLSYKNNKAPGDATVTIKGKGNYAGTLVKGFKVVAANIANTTVQLTDKAYSTKKNGWKSAVTVVDTNGKKLKAGTDYEKAIEYVYADTGLPVEATDAPVAGTVIKVTVTGKGNYTGTVSETYRVVQTSIAKAKVTVTAQTYTGEPVELKKSDITVKVGKTVLGNDDYTIVPGSYTNNVNKGTATVTLKGVGNYGGTVKVKFKIVGKSFTDAVWKLFWLGQTRNH